MKTGHQGMMFFGEWREREGFMETDLRFQTCFAAFRGSHIQILGNTGPDCGRADLFIDGDNKGTIDAYTKEPLEAAVLFQTDDITGDHMHILELTVSDGKDPASFGNIIRICGFCSDAAVNYTDEMNRIMKEEYARIKSGEKEYTMDWERVAAAAVPPESGVTIGEGLLGELFERNIRLLIHDAAARNFCDGEYHIDGIPGYQPGDGWTKWLPASNDGRMLAGAANTYRFTGREDMKDLIDGIIAKIKAQVRSDGYYNYYTEDESFASNSGIFSERKNYDRVFWTRGMLAAAKAGNPDAMGIVRRMYDWFNDSSYLPDVLEGGNATNGLPGGPLMYNSPAGKPGDMITSQRFYDQDYWMESMKNRDPLCLSHYPGERPHCYDLLGIEAFVEQYAATGAAKYLDAALGGWEVYRKYYMHPGGITAICESNGPYPPDSRYIRTGHTGETCGGVFWILINSKLQRLFPMDERYSAEIEGALYNVLAANQDERGYTRYHARLHGKKEEPMNTNTCCEVSSVGLLGSIPELIYSLSPGSVWINQYAASVLETGDITLRQNTKFPNGSSVTIEVFPQKSREFKLYIRVPSWAGSDMDIFINKNKAASGRAGSFVCLKRQWSGGDRVTFDLAPSLKTVLYTGLEQCKKRRYALMYGPILLALQCTIPDNEEIPVISALPEDLPGMLSVGENPLEFNVRGHDGMIYKPYYAISGESFTCFPAVGK